MKPRLLLASASLTLLAAQMTGAATIAVTSTADSGPGPLRAALNCL